MTYLRIIVNLLAIAVIVVAAITLRVRSRANRGADHAADPLAILDRRVAAVDFAGTSLPEAAGALSKAAGVRIAVDPAAAEIAGRVDAAEITLGGITLEENLRRLISRFNGLSYVVERDGIRIATSKHVPVVARIYDVRDLRRKIAATIPLEDPPAHPAATPVSSGQNSGIFVGYGTPSPPTKRTPQQIDQQAMDEIAELIKDSVARDDWYENGGAVGSIHDAVNGFLVVMQTPFAHRQIVELLTAIRRADTMEWRDISGAGQR